MNVGEREAAGKADATSSREQRRGACLLGVCLEGARVVCVGAGRCAERKARTLIAYGAELVVIAPEATAEIERLSREGALVWERRRYESGDLAGALLVVCATDDAEVNHRVFLDATKSGQLVNVVDDPENCNVLFPSVLSRGKLQIAVSTSGAAPGLARQIRLGIEREFPEWYGDYIDLLGEVRTLVKARVTGDSALRTQLYKRLYAAGLDKRIAAGENFDAEEVYETVVSPVLAQGGEAR